MTLAAAAPGLEFASRSRIIVGASATGASHVRRGTPCQDALCVLERGTSFAIALADGLGSAARSDLGASIATAAAASRALRLADGDPAEAALAAVVAARDALEVCAGIGAIPLRDLGCTLIVAAGGERGIGIAHVGDGAVVGRAGGGWAVLSPPGASEYLNETDPLTGDGWEGCVRWMSVLEDVDALALFTDGCQHAGIRSDGTAHRAHGGFFDPLFRFASSGVDSDDAAMGLHRLLAGKKLGEHSDDDKTLVLAVL